MNILYESYYGRDPEYESLMHSGVKGQKWGERRYQYEDGSLTPLGRDHYGVGPPRGTKKAETDKGRKSSLAEQYLKSTKHPSLLGAAIYSFKNRKKNTKEEARLDKQYEEIKARKKELLDNASRKDRFTTDFMERVQNEDFLDNHKKMVEEYSNYLDDPKNYKPGQNNSKMSGEKQATSKATESDVVKAAKKVDEMFANGELTTDTVSAYEEEVADKLGVDLNDFDVILQKVARERKANSQSRKTTTDAKKNRN